MTCLSKLYFAQSNTYFGTNLQHTLHTQTKGSIKKQDSDDMTLIKIHLTPTQKISKGKNECLLMDILSFSG